MHKNMSCSSFLSTKSAKDQNSCEELIHKKDAMERIAVKKKLYGTFLWIWFNCLQAAGPLVGNSLLFTTKSAGIPGAHLIKLGRMKG